MTYRNDFTLPAELMEQVAEQGLEILPELIRIVINAAMQAERSEHLQAGPYQHTEERRGYANGYKPKTMRTRIDEITFAVPQIREGGFYPQALEKGLRSERALTLALTEMYVQGVSTRKVKAITEQLCGVSISSSAVSQAASQLDSELAKWRERPLGEYAFLFLDAYYEQVREDGHVRDLAVLSAVGVNPQGKREILGVSVSLSEHEIHWRAFLESLKQRGLGGVQLVTSDDHAGLRAARLAVFGGIPWQRCQFHLQQNAQAYVPRKDMLTEVAADIRTISMHPTAPPLKPIWPKRWKSTPRAIRVCPSGWRTTFRKGSPSLLSRPPFGVCCAPPMAWNVCIVKSGAERGSFRSFRTRPPACGLSPQCSLKLAKNG